jgi:hypothetical protein
MSEPDTKANAIDPKEARIHALEERIHALELEKRIARIHSKLPTFDPKGKSMDYLDGFADGLYSAPESKAHNTAEVVPAASAKKGRNIGEVIDEDELVTVDGSDP